MSYFFSGGSHEKHQQHPSALPLHAARSLPQLHQVRSAAPSQVLMRFCIFVFNDVSSIDVYIHNISARFRIEQPVYINIIRDPINRFLSNYFFRRFGDWRGEQNHLIRTPGMKDDERYLVRKIAGFFFLFFVCDWIGATAKSAPGLTHTGRLSYSSQISIYEPLSRRLRSYFSTLAWTTLGGV